MNYNYIYVKFRTLAAEGSHVAMKGSSNFSYRYHILSKSQERDIITFTSILLHSIAKLFSHVHRQYCTINSRWV